MGKNKFRAITVKKKGAWTKWNRPVMNRYHLACCDCGLVHTMNFRAIKIIKEYKDGRKAGLILPKKTYQIEFKLYRNERLTKEQRS